MPLMVDVVKIKMKKTAMMLMVMLAIGNNQGKMKTMIVRL